MIYEQRIYKCFSGRLPVLLKRFEDFTLDIWDRHGIRQAGFFTPLVGKSNLELLYFLQWKSMSDREVKWSAFRKDPEWLRRRADSEKDGPIVASIENVFYEPTKFSSIK